MTHYRTLIVGALEQTTPLVVGGRDAGGLFDHSFARDGKNRLTLRGKGIAGALIATARKLYLELPKYITDAAPTPSCWLTHTTHPCSSQSPRMEPRIGTPHRQDTGAQMGGRLHDAEVCPRGTRWPLLLEVDGTWLTETQYRTACAIALAAFGEWQHERLWLGAGVARGTGWMRLIDVRGFELSSGDALNWPNASLGDVESRIDYCDRVFAAKRLTNAIEQALADYPPDQRWHYATWTIGLGPGDSGNGYGFDGVSVGGHDAQREDVDAVGRHATNWRARGIKLGETVFKPDKLIAMAPGSDGRAEPFIPGSALRGPLRSALSRLLRSRNEPVLDPNTRANYRGDRAAPTAAGATSTVASPSPQKTDLPGVDPPEVDARIEPVSKVTSAETEPLDIVAKLFGTTENSARLLIRDAHLEGGAEDAWQAAWLQHHAEDEFAGSTYEHAKFDRVVLMQGRFLAQVVLETPDFQALQDGIAALAPVFELAQQGHVPIGGNTFAGLGWLQWRISAPAIVPTLPLGETEKQTTEAAS